MIAALLTRMSMPPNASTAVRAMACADARSLTSTATPTAARPSAFERVGGLGGGALVDVGQHHGGAGFAECTPVGHADAAGTTGDDGDLPAQVEELRGVHRARPFCRP